MKVGDLVSTRSRNFVGVIIETKSMEARSSNRVMINNHRVYWGSTKVKKNPAWVNELHLVYAVTE